VPLAVCATPIGNLEDVTLRVLATLAAADLVLAEDTRHTRKLLSRHGISASLRSLHGHNERERLAEVLERLRRGERVALVSDAGMPAISDPGALLVAAALAEELPVTVLPGPSAVQAALVASGLAAERYLFLGFLPRRPAQLDALWAELDGWSWPAVAFEAPRRLPETLRSLAAALPERRLAVCRELTKTFEEVVRGSAAALSERFAEPPRGEITLVIGAGERAGPSEELHAREAHAAVAALLEAGTPRRTAVEVVAGLSGVGRNELYRASL
jgi:16S rRNA (cytidine1402-2'-O)-methyltransferase